MTHAVVHTDCDVAITKTTSRYHDSRSAVAAPPQQALPGYDDLPDADTWRATVVEPNIGWGYARSGGRYRHREVAERLLGRALPATAEIHHVDHDKKNNAPSNLVVCQDRAYHQLLHRRERALRVCGDATAIKCGYCRRYDRRENLYFHEPTGRGFHVACRRAYRAAKRPMPESYDHWADDLEGSGQPVLFPFSVEQRFRRAGVWVTQTVALCRTREDAWAVIDLIGRPLGYYYAIREAL